MLRSFCHFRTQGLAPEAGRGRRRRFNALVAVIDRVLYIAVAGLALCLILILFE